MASILNYSRSAASRVSLSKNMALVAVIVATLAVEVSSTATPDITWIGDVSKMWYDSRNWKSGNIPCNEDVFIKVGH